MKDNQINKEGLENMKESLMNSEYLKQIDLSRKIKIKFRKYFL
jgi:hypothetical protein